MTTPKFTTTAHGYLAVDGAVAFEVELHAFGERGREMRIVSVPAREIDEAAEHGLLGAIFKYGQNDFQAQPVRSVSVGDIIRLDGRRYVVKGVGFAPVPDTWDTPTRTVSPKSQVADFESTWGVR